MNVEDVVLHPAKSLDVLALGFPFLLGDDMQITGLAMSLVASGETHGTDPTKKKRNPPAIASTKT